jgi:acid phosphatase
MATPDLTKWDGFTYRRRLETFGDDDSPVVATGPEGEYDNIWYV